MAFILRSDPVYNSTEISEYNEAFRRYREYLESIKSKLPKSAYDFAVADWHFDNMDRRSPHDSWLEECVIREPSSGERHEIRSTEIFIRLLGAYHDGNIELKYKNVHSYSIEKPADWPNHDDWLYDEIRLSDDGNVLHEIEWVGSKWLIECEDVIYSWLPFAK